MIDYKTLFERVEATLLEVGSRQLPVEQIRANLEPYKHFAGQRFTDDEYYWKLVGVIFYTGFRAATVTERLDILRGYFSNYLEVAQYDDEKISGMLANNRMIRNLAKIKACVHNAQVFESVIRQYGSFQNYIESFKPEDGLENLMRLREDLQTRFRFLGKVTTYHFLTEIGQPVLKPDRVIRRIFHRLGLIRSDEDKEDILSEAVAQGDRFVQATGYPIRYIDIVLVAYGQVKSEEFGLISGICLKDNPLCDQCGVRAFCQYFAQRQSSQPIITLPKPNTGNASFATNARKHWTQETYIKAYSFAAQAHNSQQVPGSDLPYIVHLSLVGMEVIAALQAEKGHDAELAVQCALLHDTIEDTDVTYRQLESEFGPAVANGVSALTKNKSIAKELRMADSLRRIKQQPKEVWMVKLADRITNLQPPPSDWTTEKIRRYREEAIEIHRELKEASEFLAKRLEEKIAQYNRYTSMNELNHSEPYSESGSKSSNKEQDH